MSSVRNRSSMFNKLAALSTVLLLTACGSTNNASKVTPSSSAEQGIEVDQNLLTVDVTIPASFYEDEPVTQEELQKNADENGYGKATLNPDGSVTLRMSKADHSKALAEMKVSIDEAIQQSVNDQPEIFSEISYDNDVTKFIVIVDKGKFNDDFGAGFIGMSLGIQGMFYQMFAGSAAPEVLIELQDKETGEVFDTQKWPLDE
jgi:hypothetical protein